jgi:hypothetical protein
MEYNFNDIIRILIGIFRISTQTKQNFSRDYMRLQKLLKETQDPACRTAVSWIKETNGKLTCRKALE